MAALLIPTRQGEPYYTQRTRLDGREYNLRFAWNQRIERWFLDINDGDGVPIVLGLKLTSNWPLLRAYRYDPRVPPGELAAMTSPKDNVPPGLNDMGKGLRCELTYFAATDL